MTLSPDFSSVNYRPSGSSNGFQTFHLYVPSQVVRKKPDAGWPCVVVVNCSSWTTSTKGSTISDIRERMVQWGLAVCDMTVTQAGSGAGNGYFWRPEDAGWATSDIPEKDVIWAIQKLRDQAATYGLDTTRFGLYGSTYAAAQLACWVGLSPDFANAGAGTNQEKMSSRVQALAVRKPNSWCPAMLNSLAQSHLRDATVTSSPAATYAATIVGHRDAVSPIYRASLAGDLNDSLAIYLRTSNAPNSTNYAFDSLSRPTLANTLSSEEDGWQTFVLGKWLRRDGFAHNRLTTVCADFAGRIPLGADKILSSTQELEYDMVRWLAAVLASPGGADSFDLVYDWIVPIGRDRAGVTSGRESGAMFGRQTRASTSRWSGVAAGRSWEVGSTAASSSDVARLRALRTTSRAGIGLDFAPPDSPGKALVRFGNDSLSIIRSSANVWTWRAVLEEII